MLVSTIWLRQAWYRVCGFVEEGCFIPETFEPELDYNSLSNDEWEQIDIQFWSQWEDGEDEPDDDWDDSEEE